MNKRSWPYEPIKEYAVSNMPSSLREKWNKMLHYFLDLMNMLSSMYLFNERQSCMRILPSVCFAASHGCLKSTGSGACRIF